MPDTTIDRLLGARFEVEQPAKGYRIAVDTLLLASAVPASEGQRVIEFGCGVGGVMFALACRVQTATIHGLELQTEMAELCASNIRRNGFEDRLSVQQADITNLPDDFLGAFDHVMMNPPFHDHKTHSVSAIQAKRLAHAETDDADLSVWLTQGQRVLKDGGILSLIHRADRVEEILQILKPLFGPLFVKPIIAREGAEPKRVIVRAVKSRLAQLVHLPPFILYGPDNRYNAQVELILREAQAMPFDSQE